MAQGRMLKTRISKSHKFAILKTHNARLLYLMIYPHLDIEGRIEAEPRLLKAEVCPLLNFSERKILEYLTDMNNVGLIILYKGENGDLYLECTKFKDFQSLRADKEAKSIIPAPITGQVRELDGTTPALSKGKDKVKDKLSKEKEKARFLDFVLLTKEEYQKLVRRYGEKPITNILAALNRYIGQSGKKYKSHYYTLLNFAKRDELRELPTPETEKERVEKEAKAFKKIRQEIRDEDGRYFREQTTEKLRAILDDSKDQRRITRAWLIKEILDERADKE